MKLENVWPETTTDGYFFLGAALRDGNLLVLIMLINEKVQLERCEANWVSVLDECTLWLFLGDLGYVYVDNWHGSGQQLEKLLQSNACLI